MAQSMMLGGNQNAAMRSFGGNQMRQSLAVKLLDESLVRDQNSLTGQQFANTMGRSAVNSRPPQRTNQPPALSEPPTEFYFDHNFDENGILHYLGSMGKRMRW